MFAALLEAIFPSACGACGREGSGLCSACAPPRDAIERFSTGGLRVAASARYEGAIRAAVLAMKRGRRDVAAALGDLLAERLGNCVPRDAALVPAPTTRARRRERGFDQAEVLARRVARRLDVSCADLLRRVPGAPQQGRSRAERVGSQARFALSGAAFGPSLRVMLVDDVVTTGATLRDAAAALEAAGVEVLGAIVAARTV